MILFVGTVEANNFLIAFNKVFKESLYTEWDNYPINSMHLMQEFCLLVIYSNFL